MESKETLILVPKSKNLIAIVAISAKGVSHEKLAINVGCLDIYPPIA